MKGNIFLGIDVGSIAVKVVLISPNKEILKTFYVRSQGQPLLVVKNAFLEIFKEYDRENILALATTGSGGKTISRILDGYFVNEVIAQVKGTGYLLPKVRTIIEIGGEDSKFILLHYDEEAKTSILDDFAMNSICAAGTGSFLDQQANRLKISIEDEFGQLALRSKNPPRMAGRCSVFAKTDMIHLQQVATPNYDIVAGLCFAMARNFKATVAQGKKITKPVSFQGGVAANLGMVRAFKEVLELKDDELIVSFYYAHIGAIGAVLSIMEQENIPQPNLDMQLLDEYLTSTTSTFKSQSKLAFDFPENKYYSPAKNHLSQTDKIIKGFLGIDVGSLSTNLAVLDESKNVLVSCYLMTEGRPIDAIKKGLGIISQEIGNGVEIAAVGTTGSGRYLTGDFVGADIVQNEISAQATAAVNIDENVDTIFEIGGQDSKYISLDKGIVVDFEMNKACAAGTGSFLQEQAEKLNIRVEDFGDIALTSFAPAACGERCTVFMESDITAHQQGGRKKEDLTAGLCYAIVHNYLNKVVGKRKIGNNIFFQGGVAWNKGVVSAFETVLGKRITVPPHHDVTGAIGAAILAMQNHRGGRSKFKGFELSERKYSVLTFGCNDCPNNCEIKEVKVENEKPLYYGSRCEKYELKKSQTRKDKPLDLFEERNKILFSIHKGFAKPSRNRRERIGIPRTLFFYELFPLWATFFENLGFEVVLSDKTNKTIVHQGIEKVLAETCFPIKVAHGHILNLLEKNVDFIFLPSLISMPKKNDIFPESYACPYVQALPYMIKATLPVAEKLLSPSISLSLSEELVLRELCKLRRKLNIKTKDIKIALQRSFSCQEEFYRKIRELGSEALNKLDKRGLVVVSRTYNSCDAYINLELSKKLNELGAVAIPIDLIRDVSDEAPIPNMYWKYGQDILATTKFIRENPLLYPIYLTNFGCGPDSFITHFFRKHLKNKPYLQLELDEHSADAGIITRCEAFLDSTRNRKYSMEKTYPQRRVVSKTGLQNRILYIPYMADHAFVLKSALSVWGIEAQVMPPSNEETLEQGRKFTSGKECYPCILTTGDIVKFVQGKEFDSKRSAFLMPKADGPCRFGQYHNLHRMVLDELGLQEVPIISPTSKNSYAEFGNLDGDFRKLSWAGIVACDLLLKMARHFRAYEIVRGETDKVYNNLLKKLCDTIEKRGDLTLFLKKAKAEFGKIEIYRNIQKPIIGIVGEIYIRSNPFSNNFLEGKIEELGGEVWLAPFGEWISYTTYMYGYHSLNRKDYVEYLKACAKETIQKRIEHSLCQAAKDGFGGMEDAPVDRLIRLAQPYLDRSFGGEAILSIGKSIDYIRQSLCGIINTMPFTCMPGNVTCALSRKVQEDFGNFPWLNMAYDGLEDNSQLTRLEAFMHRALEYNRSEQKRGGKSESKVQ
ncbi:MAG TPA: acyl-CoA dehydratase activase [candidate division Zixibacteria bacterium]